MSARFTSRGRNQWHSDGRPKGWGMPFASEPRLAAFARRLAPWAEGGVILLLLATAAIFARAFPAFVAGLAQ